MVRHRMKAVLACGALLLAAQAFAAQGAGGEIYRARLSVVPLDVAMQANVAGLGQVTATLNGNRLTVTGDASGLQVARDHGLDPPRTQGHSRSRDPPAHRHEDRECRRSAARSSSPPQQVEDLKGEQLYVQLNSERAPEGNLRGWLLK